MKKFTASPGSIAFVWGLLSYLALAGPWVSTGQAQVSFSGHPGTGSDPAFRVAPLEPAPAETESTPAPVPKKIHFFTDWDFFPEGVDPDADSDSRQEVKSPAPLQVGNVTFNQMAESVNAWKGGGAKAGDLSRQFQPSAALHSFTEVVPAGAWMIGGIAAFALLLGLVLGQYENDREERKRQKRRRGDQHQHSGRRRHRTSEEKGDLPGEQNTPRRT